MEREALYYVDSLCEDGVLSKRQQGLLDAVRVWVTNEVQQRGVRWQFKQPPSDWPVHVMGKGVVPQQEDGFSCGVFAVLFALSAGFGMSLAQVLPDSSASSLAIVRSKFSLMLLKGKLAAI